MLVLPGGALRPTPYALALLLFKHGLGTGYGGEFFVFFRSVLP